MTTTSSHGVFPRPFLGGGDVFFAVRLVDLRNLRYQGIICLAFLCQSQQLCEANQHQDLITFQDRLILPTTMAHPDSQLEQAVSLA